MVALLPAIENSVIAALLLLLGFMKLIEIARLLFPLFKKNLHVSPFPFVSIIGLGVFFLIAVVHVCDGNCCSYVWRNSTTSTSVVDTELYSISRI